MAKLKTLAFALSGFSVVSAAGHAYAYSGTPNQVGMAMMRLNSALLDQAKTQTFGSRSLWASLRSDFRINEVNPELVRRHENKFSSNSAYFNRTVNRSKPYLYHIAHEVKKRGMPAEIALLPFIESAFVTKAKSHVGASGLWQFMPATGRHYGLERTALYDGRHDVYAATDAALNYLQYLHGLFGDWSLALAAYNWGEGNVGRAVNRVRAKGLEPTYENLRMPNETRNYVPKLLAVRNIVAAPQIFGMNISEINNKPYFKTVNIDKPIDNTAIARLANISESEFLALNPGFNAPVFIPKANRRLLLPADSVATFEKNYRKANPDSLLSWDLYTAYTNTSLSSIAAETGMSIGEIKRLNGISSNSLTAGRSILVAKNSIRQNIDFIDTDTTPDTYRSNMPQLAAVQTASVPVSAVRTQTIPAADFIQRSTIAANQVETPVKPIHPAVKTVVAHAKTETVQTAAADIDTIQRDFVESSQETAVRIVAATSKTVQPASIAANLIQQSEPARETKTVDIAVIEPLPLPTQAGAAEEPSDNLMALVEDSTVRLQAAESVKHNLVKLEQEEAAEKARAARLAENRAKQQTRTEARLARAHSQAEQTAVASGMHRVAEGDTLFNISKRYNLSVADLITANNIQGNRIQKGQLLKVTVRQAKTHEPAVRRVAYTVRRGDTLNTIASRFNLDVNDLRRWNRNTRTINPGQKLNLMGS